MTTTLQRAAVEIAAQWEAAWNAHDMARMGRLLTDDADWVTVSGRHLRGRLEIEQVHTAMHAAQFASTVWNNGAMDVRLVKPEVALVHLTWSIRGEAEPDGTPRQARKGTFSWLLIEQHGTWQIRAAQNTNAAN